MIAFPSRAMRLALLAGTVGLLAACNQTASTASGAATTFTDVERTETIGLGATLRQIDDETVRDGLGLHRL